MEPRKYTPQFRVGKGVAAAALALCLGACVSKPVTLMAVSGTGAPVPDAVVYQHGIGLFSPIPFKSRPMTTSADGTLPIVLDSRTSTITILKPLFEPAQLVVAMDGSPDGHAPIEKDAPPPVIDVRAGEVTDFTALPDHATLRVALAECTRTDVKVKVVDEHGAPLPGVEVHRVCTLFLLTRGGETLRGLPPIRSEATDASGTATVDAFSGLTTHVHARAPGRVSQRISVDAGSAGAGGAQRLETVALPLAETREARIRVLRGAGGRPVAKAEVTLGLQLDGMPPDPNGWTAVTDAEGLTPTMAITSQRPIIFTIRTGPKAVRRQTVTWDEVARLAPSGELTLFASDR